MITPNIPVTITDTNYTVDVDMHYTPDGHIACELYDSKSGELVASVGVGSRGDFMPMDGLVYAKNYSENDGVGESLEDAGIFLRQVGTAKMGMALVEMYAVNPDNVD